MRGVLQLRPSLAASHNPRPCRMSQGRISRDRMSQGRIRVVLYESGPYEAGAYEAGPNQLALCESVHMNPCHFSPSEIVA